ncbi:response regulator [Puniceicoccales bacterium CK1056]|uniref:histidine kinase n=1 Tax=Oceanipulchritudo coccoides TaxID=2706888 RepID=A0A6B2M0V3_9BACT|nr:ATP-binding protein [Oceanipulchritudo coccoides]NDV61667.1 response regulator [Oceanipulchritudo coccoides]
MSPLNGTEVRSLDSYRVDPLTESWRWQRIKGLDGQALEIVAMTPDGRLGAIYSPNELHFYDGRTWQQEALPEDIEDQFISAFFISSRAHYCVVTTGAIYLFDGSAWIKVADEGLHRRVRDNIAETSDGILWIGLRSGLARLDPATAECEITPWRSAVMSVCEGPNKQSLWISTLPRGEVWECPLVEGNLAPVGDWILKKPGMQHEILAASLMRASDGRIWQINNHHNLPASFYDPETGEWESVNLSRIGGDNFDFSILETPDGAIWISSRGSLHILKNEEWKVYHSPEYPLPGARSTMVQDTSGAVSIIEEGGMNVRIDYGQTSGYSFNGLHFQDQTLEGDQLFISINNDVVQLSQESRNGIFHTSDETGVSHPGTLLVHPSGDWILAGSDQREAVISVYNGQKWEVYRFPEVALSFAHLAALKQPNGDIWLGCAQMEEEFPDYQGGIVVISRQKDGTYVSKHLQSPPFQFRNWSLVRGNGESVYSSENGIFQNTRSGAAPVELPDELRQKWIDQIAVDAAGDLWCAVWSQGIYRFSNGEWKQFTEADGLESSLTSFVITLNGTDPVATTREGHFRFDGQLWAPFMGIVEGLHRGSGRVVQGKDGSIWINRTHVDWYYRGQRTEPYAEDKKRGFRTVQYVPDNQAPDTLWITPPSELQRNTSLQFSWKGVDAWSRTPANKLQFSHRVDGGDWSPFTASTEVTLNELKGGKHVIEVVSRDSDFNVDPTPLRAEFTVVLPLWQQAWFVASLVAGILFLISVVVFFIRQRVKHMLEIEQVKMRVFTHLSHEIKTPLSLILGPVERLQNEISDSRHQHFLSLIKSNSQRLLFLINQLLDFRKFQLNRLEFKPQEGDFVPFIRSCLAVFDGWALEKKHTLKLETNLTGLVFAFDQELFHKIIDNVVNNSVKYTPRGGRITVRVAEVETPDGPPMGQIEVEDDGPGISTSEQEAIFEPFYRSADMDETEEGSGIGLAFVKEIVTAIHGTVSVISPVNPHDKERPGSCFQISFPLPGRKKTQDALNTQPVSSSDHVAPAVTAEQDQSVILLIEDNHDLREFIGGELRGAFQIEMATNGDEGFAKAQELIPDIVISDIVMPGKDGFETCRVLKKDPHTSHIPVILLTALRSEEHRLKAFNSGADDFITKPVSPEILRLKIRNLLSTQKRSRERVREQFVDDHRLAGLSGEDKVFVEKTETLVEEHMSEEQFDVNTLAEKMGFSRSAFYRKFSNLTDLSPAAFIRTKRLRRAALWLAEGGKPVSEIAYDVGFSDAGYFSRVFKDEYKCSPSAFARKKGGIDSQEEETARN